MEMGSVFLSGDDEIIVIDPMNEYFDIADTYGEMWIRDRAESVIRQLETIGVLGSKNEDGTHTVMMDNDAFINRVRGYRCV